MSDAAGSVARGNDGDGDDVIRGTPDAHTAPGGGGLDNDAEQTATAVVACPSETDQAGRADQCAGCPGREACAAGTAEPDEAALKRQRKLDVRMKALRRRVLVVAGKGGVGKSSVTAGLAGALAVRDDTTRGVSVLDLDLCGPSQPTLLGVPPGASLANGKTAEVVTTDYGWQPVVSPHGSEAGGSIQVMSVGYLLGPDSTRPVVWRGPRKTALIERFLADTYWGRRDYLLVDTPPGTSDEHLSVVRYLRNASPAGAVVVTTPQAAALLTVRKELTFCAKMGIRVLGIVENMSGFVCPCCGDLTPVFDAGGGEALADEYGVPFLGALPLDPAVGACCDAGQCVVEAGGPLADAYTAVADRLVAVLDRLEADGDL